MDLYLAETSDPDQLLPRRTLTEDQLQAVRVVTEDGAASASAVLAALWGEWILCSARAAPSTALASVPLDPYPHQMVAVYEQMLPQPLLRFLVADEPGTGKTIMSGLWLREAQRLGLARRALVVCPAHLTHKWISDFDRFFGGGMREVTMSTIREQGLVVPAADLWVVSLDLAAQNAAVREALWPDNAGWDAVIFDEAHRLTPTAGTYHRVGRELSESVPHALFLTATPHRGDEWYFRELLHLVDPALFPTTERPDARKRTPPSVTTTAAATLKPGPLHFLRRMKEQLVDYDSRSGLFKEREAHNVKVSLSSAEQRAYDDAQELVRLYFPPDGRILAAMVYGKRAASSLQALAETLRRRRDRMGTDDRVSQTPDLDADVGDEDSEDRVVTARSQDARAEKKAIDSLLSDIDPHVAADSSFEASKWPELIGCLSEHQITPGSSAQAVIFTEYADTAHWLVRELRASGFTAEAYSGALNADERAAVQRRFMRHEFQLIVSTDAGNEGIDLQAAAVLVNWDVPWSLVRLEQRMGRIHRIGQQHKVWLYNLIASGTREGDAHLKLLERLVKAANEMGGQMFDSLDAILERARTADSPAEPQRLMSLLYDTATPTAGDWPTLEEIRAARDAHFKEMRQLATEVDPGAADAARRDDRLSRVNPTVVERFLKRATDAGLIGCKPTTITDTGFFYLDAQPDTHGWQLPEALRSDSGWTLIATSVKARQQAIAAGRTRAHDAIMLGPADPALRSLAAALRTRLATETYQGSVLTDATSRSDYTLFVYECDITEGAETDNRRQKPRTSVCSWLICVNADNTASTVAWDTLANLTAPTTPPPQPINSQRSSSAANHAAVLADDEQQARAARLRNWVNSITSRLRRLPDDTTQAITDRAERLRRRAEVAQASSQRISDIQAAAEVTRGEPRRVAWAHVIGTDTPSADPSSDDDPESEAVAMKFVTDLFEAADWRVRDVSRDGRGYDLHAVKAAEHRCVEVKGRKGSAASVGVSLTGGELLEAAQLGEDYWLYVVEHCADGTGSLYGAWPNPAETFRGRFADVPTVRLAGRELKAALAQRGDPQ
ncbi:MAG: helicase-related protein [Acidimicrobiaceae bacterium]|nr:helicase-related protein [Acidimicrobiaceae bacterium]